jgi:hypothetical protein
MDPQSGYAGLEYQDSATDTNSTPQRSAPFITAFFFFHHNSAGLSVDNNNEHSSCCCCCTSLFRRSFLRKTQFHASLIARA